jgi:hypothetical protein
MDGRMTGWTTGRMDGKEDRRRRPPQQDKTTDIIMLEMVTSNLFFPFEIWRLLDILSNQNPFVHFT